MSCSNSTKFKPNSDSMLLNDKCRRDHQRSLWRSVVPVTVRRWQRREDAEGRWGSLTKCGITKLVTIRPAGSSWRLEKRSQYPDSKSWSILKRRPSTDSCAYDGPSHFPLRGMKKAAEEIAPSMGRRSSRRSVATTTSVAWSVNPAAFWQISSN